ncbi:MAG: tetraether lipid synthase Tes [Candidatus Helarchaeota archaeon]
MLEQQLSELKQEQILRKTTSICHFCLQEKNEIKNVKARIVEIDGKVYIRKECPVHGEFQEIYWSSSELYKKFMKWFATGKGVDNPTITGAAKCPISCGLCKMHHSNTLIANIDVTNRCNLSCWYCFANAKAAGYVYEPTTKQVKEMIKFLRDQKPAPVEAVQFSGGEPTVRLDIGDLAAEAYRRGFNQIQLATNGVLIGKDYDVAEELVEGGVNTVYMKFNGTNRQTNPENWHLIDDILNNLRRAGIQENRHGGVVFVHATIKGFNEDQIYPIIKFAMKNIDIVRGVNTQPVAFVGRFADPNAKPLEEDERLKMRFTLPDYIQCLEDQSNGKLAMEDFRPIPVVLPISHLLEVLQKQDLIEFTSHPACGIATYVFEVDGEMVPITRFFDVDRVMLAMEESAEKLKSGEMKGGKALTYILKELEDSINKEKAPKKFNVQKLMFDIVQKGSFEALADFHYRSLLISGMHFQDPYNYDLERLQRCVVHMTMPPTKDTNGIPQLIPFCAYNSLPIYRRKLEGLHGKTIQEWKAEHNGAALGIRA